jgi:hypothetical protein
MGYKCISVKALLSKAGSTSADVVRDAEVASSYSSEHFLLRHFALCCKFVPTASWPATRHQIMQDLLEQTTRGRPTSRHYASFVDAWAFHKQPSPLVVTVPLTPADFGTPRPMRQSERPNQKLPHPSETFLKRLLNRY